MPARGRSKSFQLMCSDSVPPMTDTLKPPFTVHSNDDAFWVRDGLGREFGFVYFREPIMPGTGEKRVSRRLAEKTAKWIARRATEGASG
jgi:hypothetical protein